MASASFHVALFVLLLAAGRADSANQAASEGEDSLTNSITIEWGEPCDPKNRRLLLENSHAFRTVAATVRWHADGGKELTQELFIEPGVIKEIGCAIAAEILTAKLCDFIGELHFATEVMF